MGEKRTIQSIDLESKLADSLSSQRAKIEEKFLRGKKTSASKTSRERILELASMGEVGVAKSLIMQEISEDLENEKLIETMALLETYWSLDSGIYYWCNILTEANPQNIIGKSLRCYGEVALHSNRVTGSADIIPSSFAIHNNFDCCLTVFKFKVN